MKRATSFVFCAHTVSTVALQIFCVHAHIWAARRCLCIIKVDFMVKLSQHEMYVLIIAADAESMN